MKQLTSYNRATQYLNRVFKELNEEFFNNMIAMPVITIQSTPHAYGHVSVSKVWTHEDGTKQRELNISADWLNRDPLELCSTMCHEMVHLAFMSENRDKIDCMNGIDGMDTSNNGVYHNGRFKKVAERCGLKISKMDNVHGYTLTEADEGMLNFVITHQIEQILIARKPTYSISVSGGRSADGTDVPKVRKPSSTRKYICPCCGNSFRATKSIRVMCMDCNTQFIEVQ